jgi:hypothetical protein
MPSPCRGTATAALLWLSLLAAGCADLGQYQAQIEEIRDLWRQLRGIEPAPPPPTPPAVARPEAPVQALSVKASCVGRDETGYAENVQLDVVDGQVRQFDARIDVPKRGSCRFQLAEFSQDRRQPYVELAARSKTTCAIRMWQQASRVTVTATDCEDKCARGAFEYIWPIQLDAKTGGCY